MQCRCPSPPRSCAGAHLHPRPRHRCRPPRRRRAGRGHACRGRAGRRRAGPAQGGCRASRRARCPRAWRTGRRAGPRRSPGRIACACASPSASLQGGSPATPQSFSAEASSPRLRGGCAAVGGRARGGPCWCSLRREVRLATGRRHGHGRAPTDRTTSTGTVSRRVAPRTRTSPARHSPGPMISGALRLAPPPPPLPPLRLASPLRPKGRGSHFL
mmetsp:Transcript_67789/g.155866  ORF Transcript_67789/g.155866 Transcript_67789/m.155866 type:complete len:215 (+) Transcript_67789:1190-1834(+)